MRLFLLFVGLTILAPVLGCGRTMEQANLELEQDKLRLELMHAQRDELATLVKKQKEVGALEKKNEESLQQLDKRRSEIQRLEQEVKQQQAALKSASAKEDARLKAAEDQLTAKEAELKTIEGRNKDTLKRIAAENRAVYEKMSSLETRLARQNRVQPRYPRRRTPARVSPSIAWPRPVSSIWKHLPMRLLASRRRYRSVLPPKIHNVPGTSCCSNCRRSGRPDPRISIKRPPGRSPSSSP